MLAAPSKTPEAIKNATLKPFLSSVGLDADACTGASFCYSSFFYPGVRSVRFLSSEAVQSSWQVGPPPVVYRRIHSRGSSHVATAKVSRDWLRWQAYVLLARMGDRNSCVGVAGQTSRPAGDRGCAVWWSRRGSGARAYQRRGRARQRESRLPRRRLLLKPGFWTSGRSRRASVTERCPPAAAAGARRRPRLRAAFQTRSNLS